MPLNNKTFRKFETFDLKEGDQFIPSTEDNNYNNSETENEEFLVGYRTGATNTLSGKNEFKVRMQDARGVYYNTTAYWEEHNQITKEGDVYVYSDATAIDSNGNEFVTPRIKIGTGAWLGNLQFVGQATMERLGQHIADNERHVNPGEREEWNNKINIDPDNAVEDETLQIVRHNIL